MNNFLLIHTSLGKAFVAVSKDDSILSVKYGQSDREHGAFLHAAISDILTEHGFGREQISAIGVTGGPGSYTGIRVGLSAAKGLGYAWNKPLIVCSNLMALAAAASGRLQGERAVYIPVIHARKDEYYVGCYDQDAVSIQADALQILDRDSFSLFPGLKKVIFGVGLEQFEEVTGLRPVTDITEVDAGSFARIVSAMFFYKKMTDAEKAVPVYLKDVYVRKD